MAHVRTVGEIVGAVFANEHLVEEGGFVRRPPGRIEIRHVGIGQRSQVASDDVESLTPCHGKVAIGGRVIRHRMRDAPDHFELLVAPAQRPRPRTGRSSLLAPLLISNSFLDATNQHFDLQGLAEEAYPPLERALSSRYGRLYCPMAIGWPPMR